MSGNDLEPSVFEALEGMKAADADACVDRFAEANLANSACACAPWFAPPLTLFRLARSLSSQEQDQLPDGCVAHVNAPAHPAH